MSYRLAPLPLVILLAIAACAPQRYESISFDSADEAIAVAATPEPTATAVPTETAIPTAEPPTATPLPLPTSTPMPAPTPPIDPAAPPTTDTVLFDFTSAEATGRWYIVNDGVMGGVSQSAASLIEPGVLVFSGTISLDNYGGFASLRSEPARLDSAESDAIRMRVMGDGQIYHLQARTNSRIDGIAYDQPFETVAGEWVEVVLPIADFVPQFHGRVLTDQPALEAEGIRSLTISISDKQEGEFQILVDWISFVARENNVRVEPTMRLQ